MILTPTCTESVNTRVFAVIYALRISWRFKAIWSLYYYIRTNHPHQKGVFRHFCHLKMIISIMRCSSSLNLILSWIWFYRTPALRRKIPQLSTVEVISKVSTLIWKVIWLSWRKLSKKLQGKSVTIVVGYISLINSSFCKSIKKKIYTNYVSLKYICFITPISKIHI